MDSHGAGVVAILGTVGAATGAISAVLVYAICARRRRLPLLNPGGPLNWFEKDLLNRAAEEERSKETTLDLGYTKKLPRQSSSRNEEIWQLNDIDNSQRSSPRKAKRHLSSECSCDDAIGISVSPIAPPLPGGAVVASDDRMVILKSLPRSSGSSSNSRLNSADSDEVSCPRSANETRGEIEMCIVYDASSGILNVKLVEARELRARDLSETADPYAKIRLLPDKSNVWQTRIHRRTLNPVFDEDFVFEVPPHCSLAERTLEILLFDFEALSRHRGIGYVQLPLSTVELNLTPKTITKSVLRYGADGFKAPPLGELMVSLSYQPSSEKLTVIVIKARSLPSADDPGTTFEPYVQVAVIRDDKSVKKKKTGVRREGSSPAWSEILNFDICSEALATSKLQFSVLRAAGQLLARCEVSDNCHRELFRRVLTGTGASAQWLSLTEPDNCSVNENVEVSLTCGQPVLINLN
ncbi:synaptotagmin-7 [Belonocnema kinseyi]|uniref:synaptotagmin-7 n=1 Tax=Belonocnema kinseyi TaxID=2817044 RepID=UPI00143CD0BA|nr:synaptotagmin-7 [Belonocnema kinseyi]